MVHKYFDVKTLIIYVLILSGFLFSTLLGNEAVTVFTNEMIPQYTVILDAGHGGVDSGAVSCTGAYESHINLDIALKLNDIMHLLGISTIMVRDSDISVHTQGTTIATKKISDIKERVKLVNSTPNALLVSIHQNSFPESRYSGAQVFHNAVFKSDELAAVLQAAFRENLKPSNMRKSKKALGVYLLEHINAPGVLIECGFLTNPEEEKLLRESEYQMKISIVIASVISQYLNT